MPTKYRYKNRPGYYVKGSVGGRMCTWQVRPGEGDRLPWDFDIQTLQWYVDQGILYTGRSGLGDESDVWVGSTVHERLALPSYRAVRAGRVKVWTPSELDEARRLHDMGDAYDLGCDDYDEDPTLARYYYLGAAERGYARSHLELARMCDGDSERISHYICAGDLWDGHASLWGYVYAFEMYCQYGYTTEAKEVFKSATSLVTSVGERRSDLCITFLVKFNPSLYGLGDRLMGGRLEVVRTLAEDWATTFRDNPPVRYSWSGWGRLKETSTLLRKLQDFELEEFVESLNTLVDMRSLAGTVSRKVVGSEGSRFKVWADFISVVGVEPAGTGEGIPNLDVLDGDPRSLETSPVDRTPQSCNTDLMWTVITLICIVLTILLMLWVGKSIVSMDTSVRW